ncbi:MAG: hypothetical protein HETSPECPRED_001080 [Heterodermia speciosa]|uniref:Uncharacterized protein n=1 Tax=Heterodermia speciosa TaxID=116794 RepID=A0A8H3J0J4_9LECA|nr:MAG: hypothetical protein HETSPECPRED_001080 [Heterodermia speciosa]
MSKGDIGTILRLRGLKPSKSTYIVIIFEFIFDHLEDIKHMILAILSCYSQEKETEERELDRLLGNITTPTVGTRWPFVPSQPCHRNWYGCKKNMESKKSDSSVPRWGPTSKPYQMDCMKTGTENSISGALWFQRIGSYTPSNRLCRPYIPSTNTSKTSQESTATQHRLSITPSIFCPIFNTKARLNACRHPYGKGWEDLERSSEKQDKPGHIGWYNLDTGSQSLRKSPGSSRNDNLDFQVVTTYSNLTRWEYLNDRH